MAERAGVVQIDVEPGLQGVGSKIDGYMRALKPFGFKAELLGNLGADLDKEAKKGQRSLDSISTKNAQGELTELGAVGERELGRIGSHAKLTGGQLTVLGGGAIAVGSKILSGLRPAVDAASDLNEAVSYSDQVFGDSAGQIDQWSEKAAKALGQSKREAIAGATTFATFGKSAGLAGDDLVGFSTELSQLASDLASARNTSPEEAITAIGAALRGESEPIRQYGVLLDDATLRQEAFSLGLIKSTKDALTPQQKVLAAQSAIFKQTTDAQGDFARTADGLANSQRIAAAEAENAKAKFGEGLAPALAAVTKVGGGALGVLNEIPLATEALGLAVAGLGVTSILGGAVTSILGAKKALKELREEREARRAAQATEPLVDAGAAAEATVATEATARAMDDVTVASGRAGAAGSAAMGGIAAGATAATVAVTEAGVALATVGSVNLATVGSSVATIGSELRAIPARTDVIDVESWEVVAELGPGVANTVGDVGTAAASTVGPLGRMTGAIGSAVTGVRGAIASVPPLTAGLAAGAVAVLGFSSAWSQLKDQTQGGVDIFAIKPDEIQAAFDPEKPNQFAFEMEKIKRALGQLDSVGDFNATDKIASFFGFTDDTENRAKVAEATLESLKTALGSVSTAQARQALDSLAPALREYESQGKLAEGTTKDLYAALDKRESIDRGRQGVQQLGDQLDRFGFAVDQAKGKYEQWIDTINNVTTGPQNAVDAITAHIRANEDVAKAEAEVARLRAGGTKSAKDAADAERDLADAVASVTSAKRDQAASERDLANANRDLAALEAQLAHIDPNRDPNRYRDVAEQVRDAKDRQLDAQDQVANSAEQVRSAEEKVTDSRKKQASSTDELADAERNLEDARARQRQADEDEQAALAELNDTLAEHPDMIQQTFAALDEYGRRNGLAADEVTRLKEQTLLALAAAKAQQDFIDGHQNPSPIPVIPGSVGPIAPGHGLPGRPAQPPIGGVGPVAPGHDLPGRTAESENPLIAQAIAQIKQELGGEKFPVKDFTDKERKAGIAVDVLTSLAYGTAGNIPYYIRERGATFPMIKLHTGGLVDAPDGREVDAKVLGGEFMFDRGAVKRLGAGNLLALKDGAPLPAPSRVAAALRPDAGTTPQGDLLEEMRRNTEAVVALHAIVSNLANVTYAPTIHARPDQVRQSLAEGLRESRADAWSSHGRVLTNA